MLSAFIITFRETLEVALIVGIILAYLSKTRKEKRYNVVYVGIASAIVASIIGAYLFESLAGGFEGRAEKIFEGAAMLIAASLVAYMVIWMLKQKRIAQDLRKKVEERTKEHHKAGLFFLVFISVLREGIETVVFLNASAFAAGKGSNAIGILLGVSAAVLIGCLIFAAGKRIGLKRFFNITSVMLVFFSAGLVAQGIHELEEAEVINDPIRQVWDINPPQNPDESYPLLHENGILGGILKDLLGYNGDPSLFEVISYAGYAVLMVLLWKKVNKY